MDKNKRLEIKSSKQALAKSGDLTAIWSEESRLTQRILIYIARLLEAQMPNRKHRRPTPWQIYLGKALKSGKTIQEAGAAWKARKA